MIHITHRQHAETFSTTTHAGIGYGEPAGIVGVHIGGLDIGMPPEQARRLAENLIAEAEYLDKQALKEERI